MRYLKDVSRRFKNGFRCVDNSSSDLFCFFSAAGVVVVVVVGASSLHLHLLHLRARVNEEGERRSRSRSERLYITFCVEFEIFGLLTLM